MSEFKFGDMVATDTGDDTGDDDPLIFIAERHDCPYHGDPPCVILARPDGDNSEELSGWCYTPGFWKLA